MLVMEQQMLLVQISLVRVLVIKQLMQFKFHGFQLGKEQCSILKFLWLFSWLSQQMLIIQISLVCKLVMEQLMLNIQIYWSSAGLTQLVSNSNFFGQSAGATNASYSNWLNKLGRSNKCYQSNFFGQNAGNGAINVYQTSLVRQLVAQCFCFKFFLGLQLVIKQQMLIIQNFFGQVLVLVQQLLKIQISLVRC
jgi:hypothetical protein